MSNVINNICKKYSIIECIKFGKGFSNDKKYILRDCNNNRYVLRLSSIKKYELKKKQYEWLKVVDSSINCSRIIDFGLFDSEHCFVITTFLEGINAADVVKKMSSKESYLLGVKAGVLLKKWHNTIVSMPNMSWEDMYKEKRIKIINEILTGSYNISLQDKLLESYNKGLSLINNRPLVLCHGDYHLDNMIIQNNDIGIIDVVNCSLADPYEDFKRGYWSVNISEFFQTGMLNGYFNNKIPDDFFEILKMYSIETIFTRFLRAKNKDTLMIAKEINKRQNEWWGNFDNIVPTWYKGVIL